MNMGTWTVAPVSKIAGFEEELEDPLGGHSSTLSLTCRGNSMSMT